MVVTIEKLRRLPAYHAVKRCHPLLTVEQKLNHSGGERTVSPIIGGLGFGGLHEKPAHRMAEIEGVE